MVLLLTWTTFDITFTSLEILIVCNSEHPLKHPTGTTFKKSGISTYVNKSNNVISIYDSSDDQQQQIYSFWSNEGEVSNLYALNGTCKNCPASVIFMYQDNKTSLFYTK